MPLSIDEISTILDQYAELATATTISLKIDERFPAKKISFVTNDCEEHTGYYSGQVYDHAPDGSISGGRLGITYQLLGNFSSTVFYFDFGDIESITPVNPVRLAKARTIIEQYEQQEKRREPVLTIAQKATLAKEKMKQGDVKGAESLQYEVLFDIRHARPYTI